MTKGNYSIIETTIGMLETIIYALLVLLDARKKEKYSTEEESLFFFTQ